MKFDWYAATVPEVEPAVIVSALRSVSDGGEWCEVVPVRPLNGYDQACQVRCGEVVYGTVMAGGRPGEHGVHVVATGSRAPVLSSLLRARFQAHRVSRVDSAEDYSEPGAFKRVASVAESVATRHGVKYRWIRNSSPEDGDTLYIGAPTSAVRVRVYEKGKQLRGEGDESANPDHVRAEVQVRPQRVAKTAAACWSPSDVWGASRWSHALGVEYGNVDLRRVDVRDWRPSEVDRALEVMARQYGNAMRGKAAELGGFPQLWEFVEGLLERMRK